MRQLREVDCNGPGLRRRRAGKGFTYLDEDGARIADDDVVERIRALAIPPAWTDVWICADPFGHIQATGVDDRGRRQYRYHDRWTEERAAEKFDRILVFARRLPALRTQVAKDLRRKGMPKARVAAAAVRLLEIGCFRVGGAEYAKENGSFGLATMRKEHVKVRGDVIWFDFDAKSGQHLRRAVADPAVLAVVRTLRRRRTGPKEELLAYKDDAGRWADLTAEDINEYLHDHVGPECSAKDFRTWVGTVLAAVILADTDRPTSVTARRRQVREAVTEVAKHLGNTPAVARSAYIDPRVVDRYEDDDTIVRALSGADDLESIERAVGRLVKRAG